MLPRLALVLAASLIVPVAVNADPSPMPSPAWSPACEKLPATVNEVTPIFPESARGKIKEAQTVVVQISLDATGKLSNAVVIESSKNADIDASALLAAKANTYSPELNNCRAVAGDYAQYEIVDPNPSSATPQPTPTPKCDSEARVIVAHQNEFPPSARDFLRSTVDVLVQVTVDPAGNPVAASVYRSSGNADIDASARRAVALSVYAPKRVHCKNVEGVYLFKAEYRPN